MMDWTHNKWFLVLEKMEWHDLKKKKGGNIFQVISCKFLNVSMFSSSNLSDVTNKKEDIW